MATAQTQKLKISDVLEKRVRVRSSFWTQGYCDGTCIGYDPKRGVFFFQRDGRVVGEPVYEVHGISRLELL